MNPKKVRYAFYEASPEVEKEIRERRVLLIDNAAAADFRPASLGGSDIETERRERRLIGPEKIFPLADVLLGKVKGRESGEEITGFNSEGTGVQFAALANRVYLLAKERGLGRELPLSWFVQDIMS